MIIRIGQNVYMFMFIFNVYTEILSHNQLFSALFLGLKSQKSVPMGTSSLMADI